MRKGFTLLETMITTTLMAMLVVASVGSWVLYLHKANRVNNQVILDLDARNVVEQFRSEMRNAARETIMFYPENVEPYHAIGFALAQDTDGDGLMDMADGGSNILWRQTVVYHVWDKDEVPQMRRTVFSNRNNDSSPEDYYKQIAAVVGTGDGKSACLSGERSSTSIMFKNLFSGKLWHADSVFDGYAPKANTLDNTTFGSLSIGPGAHTLDFTISGKHPDSSGYNLGLDQISASVTGWPLEAETCKSRGGLATPMFLGPNQAAAAYGLNVITSGDGDKISMVIYNDAVEEAEFIGNGRNISMSNTVVNFDEEYTPEGFPNGTYEAKLDGQFKTMWTADMQSAYKRSSYFYPNNCVVRIPVMAPWVIQDGYGPVFRLYKSVYNGGLILENPVFAVVPTPDDMSQLPSPDVDPAENIPLEFYQFGVKKASWAACADKNFLELRPAQSIKIGVNSTLMLTFQIRVAQWGVDRLTAFDIQRHGITGCWMIEGGDYTTISQANWSGDPRLISVRMLPALECIAANYADSGEYISHVYDSGSDESGFKTIEWRADVPSGTKLTMYARSGNLISTDGFHIMDAANWGKLTPVANGDIIAGLGRYFQFRAAMEGQPFSQFPGTSGGLSGPYRSETPRLSRVLIKWDGETKYVDVNANMLKSPDCGRFKVAVDGKPLIRGVSMEIEIFKDVRTMNGGKERLRSAVMAEVEPRNSQKK